MPPPSSLSSAATLSTLAFACKAFLGLTTKSYQVQGLPLLLDALNNRADNKGVVTICNHNSVVDDPMMWAAMPSSHYFPFTSASRTCYNNRWTLGASDIMFTNPTHAKFFNLGQVIETVRGGGIFQPAVDTAVKRLQEGGWIHIFPEGKVNQEQTNPAGGLFRFKWGVGRIIMDSITMPEIIPMWISGFDEIMNENRTAPRFIPRPGARISITVGEPITSQIEPLVKAWRGMAEKEPGAAGVGGDWVDAAQRELRGSGVLADGQEQEVRIKITDVIQESVRRLGEKVERQEGRYDRGEWCQSRHIQSE